MNQRDNDRYAATLKYGAGCAHWEAVDGFADGAEYARKELFERLSLLVGGSQGEGSLGPDDIEALAQEYGL